MKGNKEESTHQLWVEEGGVYLSTGKNTGRLFLRAQVWGVGEDDLVLPRPPPVRLHLSPTHHRPSSATDLLKVEDTATPSRETPGPSSPWRLPVVTVTWRWTRGVAAPSQGRCPERRAGRPRWTRPAGWRARR